MLSELPGLVAELLVRELYPDTAPHRGRSAKGQVSRDPVADLMPAGSVASKRGGRITGTRERLAPLPLNVMDLTAHPRYGTVHDEYGDQIGEHAVLTILDEWARWLRLHRAKSEGLPVLTVADLAGWLLVRLDEACDDFEEIADLAAEVRHLRGALRGQLGLVGPDVDVKEGVRCPKCDRLELYQNAGSDRVECGNCPVLLTLDEYERWVGLSAARLVHLRDLVCAGCGRHQMYRVKGTAMPYCGWCETHVMIDVMIDEVKAG